MYTAPVMVSIVSLLFLGEKFSPLKIVAVAVMLVGCLFVSGVIGGFKMDGLGVFLGILSGVFYTLYNILTKILMRRGTSPMSATLYGFIFMVLFASFFVKPELIFTAVKSSPLESVPLMLLIGPMTFVLPYVLYTIAMKTLPAGTASALSTMEPMAATVFSMIIFGEIPTLLSGTGILLVLLAVFLLGRAQNNESEES
jgi:drug/metabolite transporter (DMT)-like permease